METFQLKRGSQATAARRSDGRPEPEPEPRLDAAEKSGETR
jgi:hypothetical protein